MNGSCATTLHMQGGAQCQPVPSTARPANKGVRARQELHESPRVAPRPARSRDAEFQQLQFHASCAHVCSCPCQGSCIIPRHTMNAMYTCVPGQCSAHICTSQAAGRLTPPQWTQTHPCGSGGRPNGPMLVAATRPPADAPAPPEDVLPRGSARSGFAICMQWGRASCIVLYGM